MQYAALSLTIVAHQVDPINGFCCLLDVEVPEIPIRSRRGESDQVLLPECLFHLLEEFREVDSIIFASTAIFGTGILLRDQQDIGSRSPSMTHTSQSRSTPS